MLQTIITPLLITLVTCGFLFFYFRNRIHVTERKVNLMFDLIQEHEKHSQQNMLQYNSFQNRTASPTELPHTNYLETNEQKDDSKKNKHGLIDISDIDSDSDDSESDDNSDDGRLHLSDNINSVPIEVKNITLSLEGAETGQTLVTEHESPVEIVETLANKEDIKEINLVPIPDDDLNNIVLSDLSDGGGDDEDEDSEDDEDDGDDDDSDHKDGVTSQNNTELVVNKTDKPFFKLNVKGLKAECKKRNITGYAKMKKNALLELLTKKVSHTTN